MSFHRSRIQTGWTTPPDLNLTLTKPGWIFWVFRYTIHSMSFRLMSGVSRMRTTAIRWGGHSLKVRITVLLIGSRCQLTMFWLMSGASTMKAMVRLMPGTGKNGHPRKNWRTFDQGLLLIVV